MRIDAHQHFWIYNADEYAWIDDTMKALRRDFLPPESAREMGAVGFGASVLVQARQTLEETRWLLALADAHPAVAGVVGWIDLQSGAAGARAQLASFRRHPKLVGIRHIVQSEPDDRFLLRPRVLDAVAVLEEFDLAFDILIFRRHLPVAVEFVAHFPRHRFVLDHLAKPAIRNGEIEPWASDLRALAAFPNVFAKLSGLVTEADWRRWTAGDMRPYLDVAFDAFGWQRLMIGSDWPVCALAADFRRTMGVVQDYLALRPPHEYDAVVGRNAERFWRLTPDHALSPTNGSPRNASGVSCT